MSRRTLLLSGGALVVSFSLRPGALAQPAPDGPALPGALKTEPALDAWIGIDATGRATVFTGKAELGQGIRTALIQIAAEQLDLDPQRIDLVTADTARTPNEGFTAGSHSMQDSGTAILHAAAYARSLLLVEAAGHFGVPAERLSTRDGRVQSEDGRAIGYGDLVAGLSLHRPVVPGTGIKDPAAYAWMGQPMPRVDIPGKVTGGLAYVQDLRLPGMLHARVVRPPSYGARLDGFEGGGIEALPGVVKLVRDGDFLAIVAAREWQAVTAMQALAAAARWTETAILPDEADMVAVLKRLPAENYTILDRPGPAASAAQTVAAQYSRPYLGHGSIGPSCAVAQLVDGVLTVWTHSQGVHPLRGALAELTGLAPEQVRCIHAEGSGCYGHNGADDAAGDAALLALALPGPPIRVQLMRDQEQGWEPFGPAMAAEASAALDAEGRIVDWHYAVWSNPHDRRPGGAGMLLAGQLGSRKFEQKPIKPIPQPEGGGDRNAIPLYVLPSARVIHHFLPSMPVRVSAQRSLGAYLNVFAIESFMDELAAAAEADPVEFRLRHLDDARARDVVARAAEKFGWVAGQKLPAGRGRGFGFARYKNLGAYAAVALELAVDRETGAVRIDRVVAAVDSGQPVNPDGIRNQIEGAIIQSASWTLYERVRFDRVRITSRDWSAYPILRFQAAPRSIEVHIVDRPGQPFLGTGEAGQGPTAAAIANAVADAVGVRMRDLPLSPPRLKAALGV
jgi:nicotinate dehydrogenase subunit B